MHFKHAALAAATLPLQASLTFAQGTSSSSSTATASSNYSIPAASIAPIINSTGIVPPNLVDLAANALAGLVASTQQILVLALSQAGMPVIKLTNPELYYTYGKSPAVFPSPQGTGSGDWASAYEKAKAMVAKMTNEEKNAIVAPGASNKLCAGFTGSVERLGFPGICLNDGPSGLRGPDGSNQSGFPAQLAVGASWNRALAYSRAEQMGKEFKAKGVNVALGPVIGPLGRVAKGGRNWEGFSNDPYLAGGLADPTIRGLQQNVIADAKHFIVNEQETNRNPFLNGLLSIIGVNLNNSVSSNVDDQTMHELYLWPFYDAVKAGVGSVMGSYNRINNSYGCQNSKTLNGLLKTELGFQGFTLSDWYAQHTGIASANAGLDMVMPSDIYWGNNTLANAVKNGSVNSTRLDDMATRILAAWYRYAPLDKPGITNYNDTDARDSRSAEVAFQSAVEGHVLVKNANNALPLKKPSSMSIFGWDAISGYNTSESDDALYGSSLQNTRKYTNGDDFNDINALLFFGAVGPANASMPEIAFNGTLISGGGSGGIHPAAVISPFDALSQQAKLDGTTLHTDFTANQNPAVQNPAGPCLVIINAQSSESADRSTLADVYSDTLVTNVANKCSNTIVIIHNAGIRLVDRWIDHTNVTAAIFAHPPGQATGSSLVEILYGKQSPSGRLPYTVARQESDYGDLLNPTLPTAEDPQYSQSNFTEGVFIDYKHFIKNNISPRYAFGYGLTYSNFTYSNLAITLNSNVSHAVTPPDSLSPTTVAPEGGLASLYDVLYTVSVTVRNRGSVAAAEVAQLYLTIPNSGVDKQLRGFDKYLIQPGASQTYTFPLRRRDLSRWDVVSQDWKLQDQGGQYKVMVGRSVLDIALTGGFGVSGGVTVDSSSDPKGAAAGLINGGSSSSLLLLGVAAGFAGWLAWV